MRFPLHKLGKAFYLVGFLASMLVPGSLVAVRTEQIASSPVEDLLSRGEYCLQCGNDIARVAENGQWVRGSWAHHSFGYRAEPIWVRIRLRNETSAEDWVIVSEYPWIDQVDLYELKNGRLILLASAGDASDQVGEQERAPKAGTLFFHFSAHEEREIYLRFQGASEVYVGLTLETREDFYSRALSLRDLFYPYLLLGLLSLFVNLVIYIRTRSSIILLYLFFLLSAIVYGFILDRALILRLLEAKWIKDERLQFASGSFAMALLFLVWSRAVAMGALFPRLHRSTEVLSFLSVVVAAAVGAGAISLWTVDTISRVATGYMIVVGYPVAFYAFRRGYPSAIYPILGIPIFLGFAFVYLMAGILFPGNLFTKNCLWLAHLVEFVVFFGALSARVRSESAGAAETEPPSDSHGKFYRSSRLQGLDRNKYRSRLEELLTSGLYEIEDLTIGQVAEMMHLRSDRLSELINDEFGVGFKKLINQRRVAAAKELLRSGEEKNILAIAMRVGFGTKAAFNREFKVQTGQTPTDYRRSLRTLPES